MVCMTKGLALVATSPVAMRKRSLGSVRILSHNVAWSGLCEIFLTWIIEKQRCSQPQSGVMLIAQASPRIPQLIHGLI
jgi:hypothetical protein